ATNTKRARLFSLALFLRRTSSLGAILAGPEPDVADAQEPGSHERERLRLGNDRGVDPDDDVVVVAVDAFTRVPDPVLDAQVERVRVARGGEDREVLMSGRIARGSIDIRSGVREPRGPGHGVLQEETDVCEADARLVDRASELGIQ